METIRGNVLRPSRPSYKLSEIIAVEHGENWQELNCGLAIQQPYWAYNRRETARRWTYSKHKQRINGSRLSDGCQSWIWRKIALICTQLCRSLKDSALRELDNIGKGNRNAGRVYWKHRAKFRVHNNIKKRKSLFVYWVHTCTINIDQRWAISLHILFWYAELRRRIKKSKTTYKLPGNKGFCPARLFLSIWFWQSFWACCTVYRGNIIGAEG